VHVISQKRLREFWSAHPESEGPLRAWHKIAERDQWRNFSDVKQTCSNSVDQFGRCTVFDIGGNKFRLITHIKYDWKTVFILHVLTHRDYDRGLWKADCR
jgi:mRNA interferase HigB